MSPVNAALQLKLVVGLDIEKEMLVEANTSNQVCPVGTFQGAPAVDMLEIKKGKRGASNKLKKHRILLLSGLPHQTQKYKNVLLSLRK